MCDNYSLPELSDTNRKGLNEDADDHDDIDDHDDHLSTESMITNAIVIHNQNLYFI